MREYNLQCPECGAKMLLLKSKHGRFYGCSKFKKTKCKGSHGAHPDGRPLGRPAKKATKMMRQRAHQAFDKIWESGHMSRQSAYIWLKDQLGIDEKECHIGKFDGAMCIAVIKISQDYLEANDVESTHNN